MAPTVTTRSCSMQRSSVQQRTACSARSRRSGSTVATTRWPRARLLAHHLDDAVIARCRKRATATAKHHVPMGLRWPVERTNSWFSNFGQLPRNTDRKIAHRLAQIALAVTLLLTARLIDWRNRWTSDLGRCRGTYGRPASPCR